MKKEKQEDLKNIRQAIIKDSDICVRCGLCLPHCPTYQISEVETESPRGRIAMARALADDQNIESEKLQQHLDHCLSCLACENMCPAKVPYHDLLVNTRELLYENKTKPIPKLLNFLLAHLSLVPLLQRLYKLYNNIGLAWLFKKTGLARLFGLAAYQKVMPKDLAIANFKSLYPASENKGHIAIFIGCINQLCDAKTIFKAINTLNDLGYNVHVPKQQACCGAVHTHNGSLETAKTYQKQNAKVFSSQSFDAILTLASGCHSSFKHIKDFNPDLKDTPIYDINAFLLNQPASQLTIKPSQKALLIHTPCTLKNSLKQPKLLEDLIHHAGFTHTKSIEGYGCCGAAGLNMWNNPTMAEQLAAPMVAQIAKEKPDFVVTANIGCQLHLQQQLQNTGLKTVVLHPLNLIFTKKP